MDARPQAPTRSPLPRGGAEPEAKAPPFCPT